MILPSWRELRDLRCRVVDLTAELARERRRSRGQREAIDVLQRELDRTRADLRLAERSLDIALGDRRAEGRGKMSLSQQIEWRFDAEGVRYPVLRVKAEGVHDVGRLLANLAKGNVEHGRLAYGAARALNRTAAGRATLAYLRRHGGPALGPVECEPCGEDDHAHCWQDPSMGEACQCFESDATAELHRGHPWYGLDQ